MDRIIEGWFYDQNNKEIPCRAFVDLEDAYIVNKVQEGDREVITFCAPPNRIEHLKKNEHDNPDGFVFWTVWFPKEAHNG